MNARSVASLVARAALLALAHVLLFGAGSALLVPPEIMAQGADADPNAALLALPAMAVLDVAVLIAWVKNLRLRGVAAWAVTATVRATSDA